MIFIFSYIFVYFLYVSLNVWQNCLSFNRFIHFFQIFSTQTADFIGNSATAGRWRHVARVGRLPPMCRYQFFSEACADQSNVEPHKYWTPSAIECQWGQFTVIESHESIALILSNTSWCTTHYVKWIVPVRSSRLLDVLISLLLPTRVSLSGATNSRIAAVVQEEDVSLAVRFSTLPVFDKRTAAEKAPVQDYLITRWHISYSVQLLYTIINSQSVSYKMHKSGYSCRSLWSSEAWGVQV